MDTLCLVLFWVCAVAIAYTYVGYPAIIALLARLRPRPVARADITPSVTVLVAAYNEEDCIAAKVDNTLGLDYPPERICLLVVTDGSTDQTPEIVAERAAHDARVQMLHQPERRGKAAALARAFPHARGDIVVFTDANTHFALHTIQFLVRHFADPQVGGASGSKRMLRPDQSTPGQGESLYWRYESFIKRCDSAVSSVMGVPGEVWAARRSVYEPPEADTLLDDFVGSLRLVERGWRVVYDPEVVAIEEASPSIAAEWRRRSRNAAGGWQAFFRLGGMLRHPQGLVTFQYISHRVLRWMVTPILFPLLLFVTLFLIPRPFFMHVFALQMSFYVLALLGWVLASRGRQARFLVAPFYVCLLNVAALAGGWRYLRGSQSVVWDKVR